MRLIRGWENRYTPTATGGLRLSRAVVYRDIGEEDGLGDPREGEVRIRTEGVATVHPDEDDPWQRRFGHIPVDPKWKQDLRNLLADTLDDPNLEMNEETEERFKVQRNAKVDDSDIDSPYLFCLSREPLTKAGWQKLRAALPDRYECWTVTESIDDLKSEIEYGIERWLAVNGIARHELSGQKGWVEYSFESAPPPSEPHSLPSMSRWFRKRRGYMDQQEYRFAWDISTPRPTKMPDSIDIELTSTGLSLFRPWLPPT